MTMTKPTSEQVTFTAAGSGATLRNLVDKVRESVSVKDFGAVGNGITDDAAAIQAAINTVADGTELVFPPGTYAIGSAGIAINSRNQLHLTGNGAILKLTAASILPPAPFGAGNISIRFASCSHCTMRHFEIDGNSQASNPVGLIDCTDCVLDGLEIHDGNSWGQIMLSGGTRNSLRNNYLHDGIGISRGIFAGNVTALAYMENDICIESNTVQNHPATGIVCSSIGGRVIGNFVDANQGSGIIFSGFNGISARNISCIGNVISNHVFHGIQVDVIFATSADLAEGISIVGNICESNTFSGIYAANGRRFSIANNVCMDNGSNGITIDGEFFHFAVTGNICYDTRTGGSRTQDHGISATEQTSSATANGPITISGNVCDNNILAGIQVAATQPGFVVSGASVTGNACTGSARGIYVWENGTGGIANSIVSGNTCHSNTTADLRVQTANAVLGDNMYVTSQDLVSTLTDNSATPSVNGRRLWNASNSAPTSITDLTGGRVGQEIVITATNANTTINNTATILNDGGTNLAIPSGGSVSYLYNGTSWRMLWTSF